MISIETASAFFSEFDAKAKKDDALVLKYIADFSIREPNMVAFVMTMFSGGGISNPATAALLAMTIYDRMRRSQDQADRLEGDIGGGKS